MRTAVKRGSGRTDRASRARLRTGRPYAPGATDASIFKYFYESKDLRERLSLFRWKIYNDICTANSPNPPRTLLFFTEERSGKRFFTDLRQLVSERPVDERLGAEIMELARQWVADNSLLHYSNNPRGVRTHLSGTLRRDRLGRRS